MVTVTGYDRINYSEIPLDTNWNDSSEMELTMHTDSCISSQVSGFYSDKSL